MPETTRSGRLTFMYLYTLIGAGGSGAAILFRPGMVQSLLKLPDQDPVMFGITGAVYLAFGLLSIPGLIAPLTFSPLLLLQLLYKTIWLAVVILPLFLRGEFPFHAVLTAIVFLSYIIGDLMSLPFGYLFSGRTHKA